MPFQGNKWVKKSEMKEHIARTEALAKKILAENKLISLKQLCAEVKSQTGHINYGSLSTIYMEHRRSLHEPK